LVVPSARFGSSVPKFIYSHDSSTTHCFCVPPELPAYVLPRAFYLCIKSKYVTKQFHVKIKCGPYSPLRNATNTFTEKSTQLNYYELHLIPWQVVAQLVEKLCHKTGGSGFDSR